MIYVDSHMSALNVDKGWFFHKDWVFILSENLAMAAGIKAGIYFKMIKEIHQ